MEKPTERSLLIDAYALFEGLLASLASAAVPADIEATIRTWQRLCHALLYSTGHVATIAENGFGRFILRALPPHDLAWSGSRWVPVTIDGFPAGRVQVCNYATAEEARAYAKDVGIEIV